MLEKVKKEIKKRWPKWQANRLYKQQFHRDINWTNPTEFNEKLRWIQFNTDTSKWSLLADKYRVREYLAKLGYGDMLVNLYGVWENADDIDFDKLPNSFVLKTNHGSGSVYVVEDKRKADLDNLRQKLKKDLKEQFGIDTAEPHYLKIHPVIMAEELLHQDGEISTSLIDYKFYCVQGKPLLCAVMYNRSVEFHRYDVRLYSNQWEDRSELLSSKAHKGSIEIPRPRNFDLMKRFCHNACSEFSFVRMDFYECNGKLYFGEFTFTPGACSGGAIGPVAGDIISEKIKLF